MKGEPCNNRTAGEKGDQGVQGPPGRAGKPGPPGMKGEVVSIIDCCSLLSHYFLRV